MKDICNHLSEILTRAKQNVSRYIRDSEQSAQMPLNEGRRAAPDRERRLGGNS